MEHRLIRAARRSPSCKRTGPALATSSRRSRASAASGSSQIAYQGTSHAVASSTPSVAQPADAAPGSCAAPRRPQEQRDGDDRERGPEHGAHVVDDRRCRSPVRPPRASAVRCGMLQRLVRSWLSAEQGERLERAVAERHQRDSAITTSAPIAAPAASARLRSRADQHEGHRAPRRTPSRAGHRRGEPVRRALRPRPAASDPAHPQQHESASLCAPPTTCTSTSGLRPTSSAGRRGSRPSAASHTTTRARRSPSARKRGDDLQHPERDGTPSFASG